MGRTYMDQVRERLDPNPDTSQLMTYAEAAKQFWPRFVAIGLGGKRPDDEDAARASVVSTLKSLRSRKIIRGWIIGYNTWLYPGDIEAYLDVLSEPRPVA